MRRLVILGGSYAEAWPSGHYACVVGSRVQWNGTFLPDPPQTPLHLRGDGHGQLAGQGHANGALLQWIGTVWQSTGRVCGINGVIYGPNGLLVNDHCQYGTQGFRCFDGTTLLTGDQTYQGEVAEWTRHGDVTVGQSYVDGVGAVMLHGALRKRLEPGHTTFIRFNREGDSCAVALWKQQENCAVLFWFDVSEIAALPTVGTNAPNPSPPPMANEKQTVERVRAQYPTPLGTAHAACLIDIATALGNEAGLLRKDSGTHVVLPDGTKVSQDIVMYPDGRIFDVLGDGENKATPQWISKSPVDPRKYYRVGSSTPPPAEPPPSGLTLEQRVARIEAHLRSFQ